MYNLNDKKMDYYEINVAKRTGRKTFDGLDDYYHFFATAERSCQTEKQLQDVLTVFKEKFPEPEYKINCTKWESRGHGLNVKEILQKNNRLMAVFNIPKIKSEITECPPDSVVILCNYWSINAPKYTDEENAQGLSEIDWNELQDELGLLLEVNDYDDLLVDPHGILD